MKTFRTSSLVAPIVNPGTYWGYFGYDNLWCGEADSIRRDGDFVCDDYSHETFGKAMCTEANRVFAQMRVFRDLGVVSIRAFKFGSPREYNCGDDWFDLEFEVEDDFLDRAEERVFRRRYRKLLENRMQRAWCSRDGFASAMPGPCRAANGVRFGAEGKYYERPVFEGLRAVFSALRDGTCDDELRYFGGVVDLLWTIRAAEGEPWSGVTDCLLENIRDNHSLSEFCTVLDADGARRLYPEAAAMLEAACEGRQAAVDQLAGYLASGVPEDAGRRARTQAGETIRRIDEFADAVREAVEDYHPDADRVNAEIAELREKWREYWGEGNGNACKKDAPGQMTLAGIG